MVTDFVIQIKNAALAHKKEIITPYANINKAIAKVLIKEGFLESVKEETVDGKKMLVISLRYQRRKPAITDISLVSKPSLRVYIGCGEITKNQGKITTVILSTNAGVMAGKQAIKKKAGGELLFKIW